MSRHREGPYRRSTINAARGSATSPRPEKELEIRETYGEWLNAQDEATKRMSWAREFEALEWAASHADVSTNAIRKFVSAGRRDANFGSARSRGYGSTSNNISLLSAGPRPNQRLRPRKSPPKRRPTTKVDDRLKLKKNRYGWLWHVEYNRDKIGSFAGTGGGGCKSKSKNRANLTWLSKSQARAVASL